MASPPRRGARARAYTYTPTFLRRALPRPLLGFRAAEPGPEPLVGSLRPARARSPRRALEPDLRAGAERLRGYALARFPPARVVPPPSFFPGEPSRPASPSPATSEPGVEDAVVALRSLAQVEEVPAPRTAPRSATGARSSRKRSRAGWHAPPPSAPPPARAPRTPSAARASGVTPQRALFLPPKQPGPGPGPQPARKPLDDMEYRELKNLFAVVFERPTNSNNKEWIHKRLKDHFAAHGDPRPEAAAGPDAPAPAPLRALSENEFPEPRAPGKRRASSSAPRALAPAY